jgi:branched-chain amino acid transport system permease protein
MDAITSMYVAQGIHGLAYGMILFLIASGLNIIFGMMGILNLAHASFFMLAGYFCYQVITITGSFWAALIFAPVITAICGVLLERIFLRRVHAFGHLGELILTVGIGQVIWRSRRSSGNGGLPVQVPEFFRGWSPSGAWITRSTGCSSSSCPWWSWSS